ncbi:MAG: hypothetical protein ACYDCL_05290 [Myxococcales bacterium]
MPAPKPSDPFEAALAGTLDLALGPLGGSSASPSPAPSLSSLGLGGAEPSSGSAGFEDPLAGLDLDAPSSPNLSIPSMPSPAADATAGSEFDLGLGLGDDESAAAAPAPVPSFEPPPAVAPAAPEPTARASPVAVAAASPAPAPEEKSLFTLVFNAVAFAALVAVILLAFVIYRNGGKVDLRDLGGSLRGAFGLGGGSGAPDLPIRVTGSGYYPTLAGPPLLFVTGNVQNAGVAAQRLEVELEVVDGNGRTIARGSGWPGRLPTPEDLYRVAGAADLEKLSRRLRQEPLAPLPPGRTEPFVVAVPKPPGGAEGCALRVRAHAPAPEAAEASPKVPPARPAAVAAAAPSGI